MLLIDGNKISEAIKEELAIEISRMRESGLRPPGLAMIIIGENMASQTYVRNKAKSCGLVGMRSEVIALSAKVSEKEVLDHVRRLNEDNDIDGILVQHPLPAHIDEFKVTLAISPDKDVDGFHPENIGRLCIGKVDVCFVSCTPLGIAELLRRYKIEVSGKHAVVLGRSNIVGKPMANLLVQKLEGMNATVTVCHSGTRNIGQFTCQADILIAAIGKACFVKRDMIKTGAVVIDVGINRVDDETKKSGYRLVGDVDFDDIKHLCSAITPVPGGVGPMTIAMLLSNTFKSRTRRFK